MEQRNLEILSKPWQKFFIGMQELPKLDIDAWKDKHVLMYLINKYEQQYKHIYPFNFTKPPSRCAEYIFIKKIYQMLNTNNAEIVVNYIDYVFETYISKNKRKIKSLTFFLTSDFASEYLKIIKQKMTIDRTTPLPEEFVMILNALKIPAQTYGDLSFIKNYIKESPESDNAILYQRGLNQLFSLGLKEEQISNLK